MRRSAQDYDDDGSFSTRCLDNVPFLAETMMIIYDYIVLIMINLSTEIRFILEEC